MVKAKNAKIVESALGRWHPGDLAFIERLEYSTCLEEGYSALKLVGLFQRQDTTQGGWPSPEAEFYRVYLLFEKVRDLFITDFGRTPKQIMGFNITDISNKGWENVKFEVEDYEDRQIGFLCNSVEVLSIERAGKIKTRLR